MHRLIAKMVQLHRVDFGGVASGLTAPLHQACHSTFLKEYGAIEHYRKGRNPPAKLVIGDCIMVRAKEGNPVCYRPS